MEKSMVYIGNDSLDPYFNLALEYYLTTEKTFADSTVLLFWRTSPTLMIGKYQNTLAEINQEYAERKGISIVRRMSGGGTVYTDLGSWEYSFITREDSGQIRFDQYVGPILGSLRNLGVKAEFDGRNDLLIGSRKFSGTAQYRNNGFAVYHGTLLYGSDLDELAKSTRVDQYKIISKGFHSVRERVTNISDYLREPIGMEEFRQIMVQYLLGENGTVYTLTPEDTSRVTEIAAERFRSWDSIYGKNPQCNLVKKGRFHGGEVEIHLNVNEGKITEAVLYGNFFGEINKEEIEKALIGCRYQHKAIRSRLERLQLDEKLHEITAEQILTLIV